MKKLVAAVWLLCVLQEAWVSQVHVEEIAHKWERSLEYGLVDLEYYHRTGVIHSPIILVKQAAAEILDGRVLLFLEPHQDVWRYFDDSPEEGESLLTGGPS